MYKRYMKRLLDIIFSIILCSFAIIPMIISSIAIKLESKGPVLFKQKRTGKNGKCFYIYKFRTMIVKTHTKGRELTHNERVTKVGKFLRKTSIDELPQLFNILKGDMSFIGPRPWMEEYYDFFNNRQIRRVEVLPGISGLAQVKGRNGITVLEKLEYDIDYVDNISLTLDIKILFWTLKTILTKDSFEISQEGIKEEINVLKEQFNIHEEAKVS